MAPDEPQDLREHPGRVLAAAVRARALAWLDELDRLLTASTPLRSRVRAALQAYLPGEAQHLFALTLLTGVVCGLVAVAFHLSIRGAQRQLIDAALSAGGHAWIVWTIVTPTAGGLLIGAALTSVLPGARGSGIPQVKKSYALEGGRLRFRDAFGKFWLSTLQIGSGASLGREGPTVQICAGTAALLARLTALPASSTKRLVPVGVAAGIAAAFNAPIAAVTFTIEEIVGSLDEAVLSGAVVAAALAAIIERSVLGEHPVIAVSGQYGLDHVSSVALYAVLGVVAAGVSIVFTDGLLSTRLAFRRLELVPRWAHPAIGGLATGVLAVAVVLVCQSSGIAAGLYETLGDALAGRLLLQTMLVLCVAKLLATILSYSSGGAGGIFAPTLFVGAMLGGAVGFLDVHLLGHETSQIGAFALVGMGAVFAGVIRAPITSVLIIMEMTGSYGLVLPLMIANMSAYVLARRWRPTPIYEALLAQDGVHLPHVAPRKHALERLTVSDAMTREVVVARGGTVGDSGALIAARTFSALPVVDVADRPLGLVPLATLRQAPPEQPLRELLEPAETIEPTEPLVRAAIRMNEAGVRQLLVVEAGSAQLLGIVAMSDVLRAQAEWESGATTASR